MDMRHQQTSPPFGDVFHNNIYIEIMICRKARSLFNESCPKLQILIAHLPSDMCQNAEFTSKRKKYETNLGLA